jgi:hypothetical protein
VEILDLSHSPEDTPSGVVSQISSYPKNGRRIDKRRVTGEVLSNPLSRSVRRFQFVLDLRSLSHVVDFFDLAALRTPPALVRVSKHQLPTASTRLFCALSQQTVSWLRVSEQTA